MKDYQARRANIHDSYKISELLNSAYRGEGSKVGWTTEADLVDGERANVKDIQSLIEASGSHFVLVCEKDSGLIVGCINAKEEGADILYFGMLAVSPNRQNCGIGKILIGEVEEYARKTNRSRIRITVIHCRHELIAYYKRLGFEATGNEEEFPLMDLVKIEGIKLLEFVKTL